MFEKWREKRMKKKSIHRTPSKAWAFRGVWFALMSVCMAASMRLEAWTAEQMFAQEVEWYDIIYQPYAPVYREEGLILLIAAVITGLFSIWVSREREDPWLYRVASGLLLVGAAWTWIADVYQEYMGEKAAATEIMLLTAAALIVLCGIDARSVWMKLGGALLYVIPAVAWVQMLFIQHNMGTAGVTWLWGLMGKEPNFSLDLIYWAEHAYTDMQIWVQGYLPVIGLAAASVACVVRVLVNRDRPAAEEHPDAQQLTRFLWIATGCLALQPVLHGLCRGVIPSTGDALEIVSEYVCSSVIRAISWSLLAGVAWAMRKYGRRLYTSIAWASIVPAGMELRQIARWYTELDSSFDYQGSFHYMGYYGFHMIAAVYSILLVVVILWLIGNESGQPVRWQMTSAAVLAAGMGLFRTGVVQWLDWLQNGAAQGPRTYIIYTMRAVELLPLTVVDYVLPAVILAIVAALRTWGPMRRESTPQTSK